MQEEQRKKSNAMRVTQKERHKERQHEKKNLNYKYQILTNATQNKSNKKQTQMNITNQYNTRKQKKL